MSDLPRRAPRATVWACAAVALAAGIGLAPPLAWAMGVEGHPRFGAVLFALGVLVVAAKAGGLLAERWGQSSVLGELVVGIGLGNFLPPLFGEQGIRFVQLDPTLRLLAEVGVLPLLSQGVYSASVFMVVITTLMTPIGLRWAFGRRRGQGRLTSTPAAGPLGLAPGWASSPRPERMSQCGSGPAPGRRPERFVCPREFGTARAG